MATNQTVKKNREQEPRRINEIEVLDLKGESFAASHPSEYVILENRVMVERNWLEVVNQLIKAGYVDSTRNHSIGGLSSFIQAAVVEKLERTMVDYQGLGKVFAAQLQKQFVLNHQEIKGINEKCFTDEGYFPPR